MTTFNDKTLLFGRDVQGYNAFSTGFADVKFSIDLPSGTAKSFTIPSSYEKWIIAFSYSPSYTLWVARNQTASFPAGSSFDLTNSELNPSPKTVYAGDVISCIAANAIPELGVTLYAIS